MAALYFEEPAKLGLAIKYFSAARRTVSLEFPYLTTTRLTAPR